MQHLVDGEAHDVPVHGRDPMKIPVLAQGLDAFVNDITVLQHAADERFGEQPDLRLVHGRRRQLGFLIPLGEAFFVLDGRRPLGTPELGQLQLEVLGRVQVMLKQELYCAFPRFASFSHSSADIMP